MTAEHSVEIAKDIRCIGCMAPLPLGVPPCRKCGGLSAVDRWDEDWRDMREYVNDHADGS